MKRWTRLSLLAVVAITLGVGIVYEFATHVGRGLLCGEAFYQGRPTSYWRCEIEAWVARFDKRELAAGYLRATDGIGGWQDYGIAPRPSVHREIRAWLHLNSDIPGDDDPPAILNGEPDAEEVLAELDGDSVLQPFVDRAKRKLRERRDMEAVPRAMLEKM